MRKEGKKAKFYALAKGVVFLTLLLAAVGSKMGGCGKANADPVEIKLLPNANVKVEITSEGVTKTADKDGHYKGEVDAKADGSLSIKLDKNKTHKIKAKGGVEVSFKPSGKGTLVIAGGGKAKTGYRFFPGGTYKIKKIEATAKAGAYPTGTTDVVVTYDEGKTLDKIDTPSATLAADETAKPAENVDVSLTAKVSVVATGGAANEAGDPGSGSTAVVDPYDAAFASKADDSSLKVAKEPTVEVSVVVTPTAAGTKATFAVTSAITPGS